MITSELMVALIKYHVINVRDDEEMNKKNKEGSLNHG